MSDLIERLCEVQGRTTKSYRNPDGPEAANEIERLQLELKYKLDQSERIKNLEAEIERLNKRHDDFLQEFWKTNAENAKLQAVVDATKGHYCELVERGRGKCEICDAIAALEETDDA